MPFDIRWFPGVCASPVDLGSFEKLRGAAESRRVPDSGNSCSHRIFQGSCFGLARGGIRRPEVPRCLVHAVASFAPSQQGCASARKPSDIERQSSPGSPQTFPDTQEAIEEPWTRTYAPEIKWSFIKHSYFFRGSEVLRSVNLLSTP